MTVANPEALAAAFSGALNDGDADALAAAATNTPIAALPTAVPDQS